MDASLRRRARKSLDGRLATAPRASAPPAGWLRAVQQALGLSGVQVARRIGVPPQSVAKFERSEADGTIGLSTLRRVAEALECEVVYALVPKQDKTFEDIVQRRAHAIALRELAPVRHTMALEAQSVSKRDDDAMLADLTAELVRNPRRLWTADGE